MLDKKFFDSIDSEVVEKYRRHIFVGAKDVKGRKFKGYSKLYGEKKRAKAFKVQWDKYANSKAPVLTGGLLKDFNRTGVKTSSTSMEFGWSIFGARVEHLRDMGRVLTSKDTPIPKGVDRYLRKEAAKYIFKGLKKEFGNNKIIKLNIGKRKK